LTKWHVSLLLYNVDHSGTQWLTSTQKAEVWRIAVGGQLEQKVSKTLSQFIARHGGVSPSSQQCEKYKYGYCWIGCPRHKCETLSHGPGNVSRTVFQNNIKKSKRADSVAEAVEWRFYNNNINYNINY
jgi:hypothetical protein